MTEKLTAMLKEWNDPYGARTVSEAEDLISALQVELAGKESVIDSLKDDLQYYKLRSGD